MTVKVDGATAVMRQRFGSWIKQQREDLGMTQLDVAMFMGYDYSVMVSQIERGVSAMPACDLRMWAEVLRMKADEFAKQYLYYCQPFIFESLYGKDPYAIEKLPKPPRTIKSSASRSPARRPPVRK